MRFNGFFRKLTKAVELADVCTFAPKIGIIG